MWHTNVQKYINGCIFGVNLTDKQLAEAKEISLLCLERTRKLANERIQKTLLLYSYLDFIEQEGYTKVPLDCIPPQHLEKIRIVLSKYPFSYDPANGWNISNFLAALSAKRYDNFYLKKGVSRLIFLHRLFNMNVSQLDHLLEVKRSIGATLRNSGVQKCQP